ncbi:SAM-dependent methyltransferase [Mycolicibacterium canariasense]|uniref:SAM-dependent methyltransferase n=1 Tax=Mycolicibacterium canariasense TaxID=228230 RepID=A0A124E1Y1_MYCCR|nr:class I SAM-dependent methyltransferase [Mycolicibacterium canariasense]MCV7209381.1 class I SAM-dependent methyltransferase [Mycolicibacterium canariasense]GAS95085.1 SAM-dependent methyltransferase [Mycolicibacterium canariasense]
MGVAFGLDDVAYLRGDQGRAALAEVGRYRLTEASRVADIASARTRFGDRTAVLVETVLLRRRAAAKFVDPAGWLFTDEALQQCTAEPVARHRAARLAGRRVHDVTCSVGAELAALRDTTAVLLGSDLDPVRLAMARSNVAGVQLCRADALVPVTRDTVVVADPARRSAGRRRFDPRDYTPALDLLLEVYRGRDLVVKCAPGIDFGQLGELGFHGEIEVCSLGGSVREACLWSAGLATAERRATLLDRGEQVTDADPDDCAVAPAGRWIVDPDGAVVRAGLVRQYGTRHGLWQLDPDIAYLSGDELPDGVRGFEVLAEIGFDEKRLRRELSARDAGAVEILVRGVDVDPDALRRRLKPRGAERFSVVITRIGTGAASRAVAFICRPSR